MRDLHASTSPLRSMPWHAGDASVCQQRIQYQPRGRAFGHPLFRASETGPPVCGGRCFQGKFGRVAVELWRMILVNTDGALDGLGNYGLDGRDCIIPRRQRGRPFPDLPVVLKASMYQALADWRRSPSSFGIASRCSTMPLLWQRYYNNNVL